MNNTLSSNYVISAVAVLVARAQALNVSRHQVEEGSGEKRPGYQGREDYGKAAQRTAGTSVWCDHRKNYKSRH